jgi:hypothetical protein
MKKTPAGLCFSIALIRWSAPDVMGLLDEILSIIFSLAPFTLQFSCPRFSGVISVSDRHDGRTARMSARDTLLCRVALQRGQALYLCVVCVETFNLVT